MCWPLVTIQNGVLCQGTTVRMCYNWSAIEESVLLGVPKVVGWLGLMSAFQLRCKILEKRILSLFCWHFCWGQ